MKVLITNDDGIDAPGLQALLAALPSDWRPIIVAPVGPQSGCSHSATTGHPVVIEERGIDRYAIHGTPVDCVRLGLHTIAPDITWILSGVNHGGNLGADVYYSGTVAATREGALHGIPGIAFSHYKKKTLEFDWQAVTNYTRRVLNEVLPRNTLRGEFWNVNYPHLDHQQAQPEIIDCATDRHPLPLTFVPSDNGWKYAGDYHNRPRAEWSDVAVCFGGQIALAKLSV